MNKSFSEIKNEILSFNIDSDDNELIINIKTNNNIEELNLYINNEEIEFKAINENKFSYILNGLPNLKEKIWAKVTFEDGGKIECNASLTNLYKSKPFIDSYTYKGELGAIYNKDSTIFRVWSPISKAISLRIYECGTPKEIDSILGNDEYQEYPMLEIENGVFEAKLDGDLEGKYYTYIINNYNYLNKEIVDPYTKGCGINGLRGMIVDFSKTNPEGWDEVKLNGLHETELMVYETHIVDLTSSDSWNGSKENKMTYVGFYEEGTTYTRDGVTVKTGFDHIKELGVNTVQLLPIFRHNNEERPGKRSFNWGYDPQLYNALDGSYSKNPYDGYERIKEFKNLVMAYSRANINIIMDVVYNHMFEIKDNSFEILMPEYYFRYKDGKICDGSACGNETASDKPMFRKFMVDSTEFWAKEYKLAGFRFDLMGLHDIETMNILTSNLKAKVNPRITVYGEPWNAGGVNLPKLDAAVQSNMNSYIGFGCFNDKERDALIKGGIYPKDKLGWVNDENNKLTSEIEDIKAGIKGLVIANNPKHEVEKCLNYVTCHDNFTLYDRFIAAGCNDLAKVKAMSMLAQAVALTSEGINFMLAGEEFLRTKGGNDNSYNSSYLVNELDYSLKVKNLDLFNNYKALIALHNNTSLFDKGSNECKNILVNTSINNNVIYYELIDNKNNCLYKIAHRNGYLPKERVEIDFEGFTKYLDTSFNIKTRLTRKTNLKPFESIIAYKKL